MGASKTSDVMTFVKSFFGASGKRRGISRVPPSRLGGQWALGPRASRLSDRTTSYDRKATLLSFGSQAVSLKCYMLNSRIYTASSG